MEDRMTSKLVVNTIEADTGISSVSFASSISLSSTSKFFFSDAGIDIGPDTNINRPATGVLGFDINGSEKVRITSDGKVGIGLANPTYRLHVYGGNVRFAQPAGTDITLDLQEATTANPFRFKQTATEASIQTFASQPFNIRSQAGSGSTSHLAFWTRDNERIRITPAGKVGIGVTNPDAKFEVRDNASTGIIVRSTSTQSTDTNKALRVRNNSDTNTFSVSHKGLLEIARGELGTYLKVGGDDASNGRALTFTSSNSTSNGALHTINATSGNGVIALATAGTERFRVQQNGYITMPFRPAFKCHIATQASPNNGVVSENNGFTLNATSYRDAFNNGSHFSEATGRFTAPVTGLYYFHFSVMRYSSNGSGSMDLRIKKNASLILARSYRANYSTEGNFASMNVTTITNMSSGHYIEFILGANMSVYEDDSYMLGYLLG